MKPQANEDLRDIAQKYNLTHRYIYDLGGITEGHYVPVNKQRAAKIAALYDNLPAIGGSFATSDAYGALVDELIDQWQWITEYGYHLEPWTKEGQPYENSSEMRADLADNKHLYYFQGGEPHPYLDSSLSYAGIDVTGNEALRAVHDVFGHGAEGFGFGARGEENAWIHHSMMFSPVAQRALTTETRGQNSWVNFGPFSHLPVTERPYATQKVALLPAWCWDYQEALRG